MEKLDLKLIDMRAVYEENEHNNNLEHAGQGDLDEEYDDDDELEDPFFENSESHNLIGVANVFLSCLFSDVAFEYYTPIISQQGEVAGRLQVQIQKVRGGGLLCPQDRYGHCETNSESSSEASRGSNAMSTSMAADEDGGSSIAVRVTIKQAAALPPSLSHFVFCQYNFWGEELVVVPPVVHADSPSASSRRRSQNDNNNPYRSQVEPVSNRASDPSSNFKFNHEREFVVPVTEEFLEHCAEGALSIEVYGHHSAGINDQSVFDPEEQLAKARSLADR